MIYIPFSLCSWWASPVCSRRGHSPPLGSQSSARCSCVHTRADGHVPQVLYSSRTNTSPPDQLPCPQSAWAPLAEKYCVGWSHWAAVCLQGRLPVKHKQLLCVFFKEVDTRLDCTKHQLHSKTRINYGHDYISAQLHVIHLDELSQRWWTYTWKVGFWEYRERNSQSPHYNPFNILKWCTGNMVEVFLQTVHKICN